MIKPIKPALLILLLLSMWGTRTFSQTCTYTVIGRLYDIEHLTVSANHQVVIFNYSQTDTITTDVNGAFEYTTYDSCDSAYLHLWVLPLGCDDLNAYMSIIPAGQTDSVLLFSCGNSQSNCSVTPVVNNAAFGNVISFSWSGTSFGAGVQSTVWDFGNGYVSNNYPNGGNYTYSNPGTYNVCVTVDFTNGCSASACQSITTADTVCEYKITGQLTNASNQVMANHGIIVWSNAGVDTVYTNPNGVYEITHNECDSLEMVFILKVMGCSNSNYIYAPVNQTVNQPLVGCGTVSQCWVTPILEETNSPNTIAHKFTSSNNNQVRDGYWDYGNGDVGSISTYWKYYNYQQAGTYPVCVTLEFNNGCVASGCNTITIDSTRIIGCAYYMVGNDTLHVDCGKAYLIRLDSNMSVVDSVDIDEMSGAYSFVGTYTGNFTVLVQPCESLANSALLLPTYFGSSIYWYNADSIPTYTTYIGCIMMVDGQNVQGVGQIGGHIIWMEDKAVGDPAVDVNVLILDSDGAPIKFSVTDAEGKYSFDNMPLGTYQIYPEYAGYITYPIMVTLTQEEPSIDNVNFSLGFGVFMGIDEQPITSAGLYPNPTADLSTLSIVSKESGQGIVKISDLTGKVVSQTSSSIIYGQQNIHLNTQHLNAGIYTVALILNGQQMHVKLIKN